MNRSDRRILLAALVVGLLALIALYLVDGHTQSAGAADDTSSSATDSAGGAAYYRRGAGYYGRGTHQRYADGAYTANGNGYAVPVQTVETFPFDPNTADSTQLLRLGLQPWQVRNIYKYRARGGVYRRKEDFARLYGLTVKDYRRLEPYIRIGADYQPAATLLPEREHAERDTVQRPVKLQAGQQIELSSADTSLLKRVPGIGSYYASEIVRHGEWLGGYVSVDQLDEIDGFPQQAKQYFVVKQPHPRKIAVNRLTLQQLRRHPYINFHQAKAIVDYRRLHGDIQSLQQLRLLPDFPPEAILRLEPYVEY